MLLNPNGGLLKLGRANIWKAGPFMPGMRHEQPKEVFLCIEWNGWDGAVVFD